MVLIGAEMPSVLTEISFISNPSDEKLLKKTEERDTVAEGFFRGVSSYLGSLNSLNFKQQKMVSIRPASLASVRTPSSPASNPAPPLPHYTTDISQLAAWRPPALPSAYSSVHRGIRR